MGCEEKRHEECKSRWLLCDEGLPRAIDEKVKMFKVLMPNVLLTGLSNDMAIVYYMFYNKRGAGFFIEMDNASFNFSECRESIKVDILNNIGRLLRPEDNIRLLEYIVENVMFPS
ncbi:MAG: hypothetical protein F7B61_02825 [Caldisphaeraceae archaeon]|nr:hypothetical protein [Caldisphaeraceae archaeon]